MITIARFNKPEEAHLARLRLESAGIPAYVLDENLVQMDWLITNAIGGVRPYVDDEDGPESVSLLKSPQDEPLDGDPWQSDPAKFCPACSSSNVVPEQRVSASWWPFWILFHLPVPTQWWRCSDCDHAWK